MRRSSARLLTVALAGVAVLAAAALVVIATGRAAFVVTHGVSMNPVYVHGDLVVVARKPGYAVGQIVAYRLPASDVVVLHRIVGGDARGFVFKGDNNRSIDPTRPPGSQLVGRAVLHIPHGGLWLERATSPAVLAGAAFALLAGGAGAARSRRTRRRRGPVSRHAAHRARTAPALGTLPAPLRQAGAATAAVGVAGLALGAVAWTGPLVTATTSRAETSRSVTFGYSATVPLTAAYDGTTVRSPDPVFRKLASAVAVRYDYRGAPGTVAVAAELSLPGGWRSVLPLAERTAFSTSAYGGDVRLDLKAIEAKSQAAAAVTGLSADQISVTVVPTIVTADGATFAPALALRLTGLALAPAGDPKALTVTDTTPVTTVGPGPRRLHLLGRSLTAATARTTSAAMVLGAVLAALLLAALARALSPRSEGAGIRRRYAPLLVQVQPMPTPSGRPVVDVTEFATLAKLAERYGLLVMHWTRSGVETFVVQDDATTFRYRTGAAATAVATTPDAERDLPPAPAAVRRPA